MESFKPVLGQADLVTIARCPICSGAALYCLDRYMQTDDRDELERLSASSGSSASTFEKC